MKRISDKMTTIQKRILLSCVTLAFLPSVAIAATFQNPLPAYFTFSTLIENILKFLLGIMGLLALLGIVYGGVMLVVGGMRSEQDLKRGKEIIFWSIAGLIIVGMAAFVLFQIRAILGLGTYLTP
jgi:hypothetical protein